nr:site-specific integrase [Allomuricauda sp.]|tara:strand:+ start:277 stop:1497 length:1221 start_codon:yes stop_codon:yes gene_type:complete
MRTSSTFSILFWIYASRAVNNQTNLYLRLTLNGQRVNISLKRKVDVDTWNSKTQRANGSSKISKNLNIYLNNAQAKIYKIYERCISQERPFDVHTLKEEFLGEKQRNYSFQNLIDYYNEKMQHKLHSNTLGHYKTSQRYMLSYILSEYGKEDIGLNDLSFEFVIGFESFLRSYVPLNGKNPMGNNTAMKHIKRLKRMTTLAYRMEWINRDPFVNFKIKTEKKEREFLTAVELESIENLASNFQRLTVVRDIFVFSCYTGISYVDIINLTPSNVKLGIDGKFWIMSNRIKTGIPIKIPLLPTASAIIEKYQDHPRTIHYGSLLPKISNQKLNSYLKEIADLCGIKKNLTFHMARHTFATTVTLGNGVPIETVSKLLGHTKLTTTQIYARVVEKKVSEDMSKLKMKLC